MTAPLIKLALDCSCIELCDHAIDKISEIVQEAFDCGYDEGWEESLSGLRDMMILNGVIGAKDLSIPPPPPRKAKKAVAERHPRRGQKDYSN